MASDHPTAEELTAYRGRALAPIDLLRVSDHLAECSECRDQVAREETTSAAAGNLSYEELVEYLDEDIEPIRRRELSKKLQGSPASRAELADLAKFRDEINTFAPNEMSHAPIDGKRILVFPRTAMRWALPIAAAIALTGGAIWRATRDNGAAGTVTLRDGDRSILLKASGRLRGLAEVPHELLPVIATAMREGKLEIPAAIQSIASNREILAGAPEKPSEFQVKSPIATAVRERMPHFNWRAQPGAAQYRIRIVDWQSGEVVMTGESDGPRTEWAPAEPLDAGKVYQWQVEALRDNDIISRSPKPPEPEARFKILSDNERLKVESVIRSAGRSHLALAVTYTQAGLLDEAIDQLRILAKENPDSQIPLELIAQIETARAGEKNR
jgi:anti-sigma factor RsiW